MPSFELTNFSVFIFAAVVLAITPGPGMLYVLARTVSGGRADGIASTLGTGLGGLVHVFVAAVGLSTLLAASANAFLVVKYIGAAYLLFLGIRTILSARKQLAFEAVQASGARRAFFEGVLTEALNVKTALFFLAFIPQFVNHQAAAAPQFVALGLICVLLNTTVDFLVVLGTARLLPYLKRSPKPMKWMSYGSGVVLLGLGGYVALADAES